MGIFSMILSLLSGVALFLFGMSLMGDGLKMVAGNKLEAFLYRMTNTPLKGVAPIKNEEILALSFTLPAMNKAIGTPIERTTEQITPAIARPDIVFNSIFIPP